FTQVVDNNLAALRGVKQLLTGGDVVSAPHVRRVLEELRIPVTACYGPTESTLFASTHRMTSVEHVGASVPIGKPLGNTRIYLLDASGQPVPVGVMGELFIGGDGVARGYVEQPALTAERFVPDAFSGVAGARLYRTGDLARWRSDGVLEFLGRADAQVKVRGYRIELAEVEAALVSFPDVGQAVALVREDVPGDKRLVGYVAAPSSLDMAALRTALKQRLPEYMVPSALVRLDTLPLTTNAKVDRKALPPPDAVASNEEFVAPRTRTEEQLAELFAGVLRLPKVSVTGNFFELGGHSLLATQLVSRIRAAFGVELPLRALFEASTVSALAERIDASGASSQESAPPLVPVPRTGPLPLSFAQQRLWFIDQLEPGGASYSMPTFVRMEGTLDADALRRALAELASRHEALRTTFSQQEGQPLQRIAPHGELPLEVVDLSGLEPHAARAELERRLRDEVLRPFNLATGPLVRAQLLKLSTTEHVLALNMHHIVSDGWSMGVLVREVAALYEAFSQGRPSPLPPLPIQYADYAVWQRGWLQGEALDAQLGYWKQHLAGVSTLELPTDKPRPPVQTFNGAHLPVALSRTASEALQALCQREGATPFMALLGAFQVLLSRHAGQQDIAVGSPIAGRTRAETEGLIGFFVNTLVLRTQVEDTASFVHLLRQVKESSLGAYAHQDVPFERLVEVLQPSRDMSRSPLFQVLFALQNAPMPAVRKLDLTLSPVEVENPTTKFELQLNLSETPDGYRGTLSYNTDLFEHATALRIASHFQVLVEALVARPEAPLGSVSLLTEAERHQVLVEWNATATDFAGDACVHQRVEAQARRAPDALAVESDDARLTYRELDARANQLAHVLRARGVRTGDRVALCVQRSPDMVVGLLGILKAGAAYVPLAPDYPRERLAFMLQDCGARVLLTQQSLLGLLPEGTDVVCLDSGDVLSHEDTVAPAVTVTADDAAYVIYTSGSTGQPKGVVIPHGALVNHMAWFLSAFGITSEDRVLQKTPLSFDASVWECWASLMVGAPLVLAPPEAHRDPAALVACVVRQRVTVLQVVPSMLRFMLEEEGLRAATHLRWLFCGGEALASELAPRLRALLPETRLVNLYGPTETTIDATSALATGQERGTTVPIGRPVANTRLYVLDGHLRPVPPGVPGELFIGGAQLAQGYLDRPALTAERFVPDAFASTPGARLYRTGDQVRWLRDGSMEYLGRADAQVKLRGFRIEPGEVEAALLAFPDVTQAVALVREDVAGAPRLAGYVTAPASLDTAALRTFLLQRLPEYMVPSAFMVLEALPLTPNGKVDRKALPAPAAHADVSAAVAPRDAAEEVLAGLFAGLLRQERVGIHDSFFELGGHSLLVTQLASRVRSAFGVELPLRAFFESPTVATLARRIAAARSEQNPAVPPLAPVPREGALPLSFAQQRLWLLDQIEPGNTAYNLPTVIRLRGALDVAALEKAFTALVERHESLRTLFTAQEDEPTQRILPPSAFPLTVVDLGSLPPDEREARAERLALEETQRPFDLARGPLLRALLLRLDSEEHVLAATMHHIVSDGWSMSVLVSEVAAAYGAFASGRELKVPPLPIQYADYAAWQRGWLRGDALEQQLGYWREQLSGAAPVLELPTDKPRPAVQSIRGLHLPVHVPAQVVKRLEALCQREGVTPFMALLAVWQVLLSRYSGQDDIVVGSPIAGRTRTETEGLIGFFVNTLVLRTQVDPRASFRELLARVRATTLGAYDHQDVPFEKLVEELQPQRSISHSPLFQVMLVLQNTPMASLEVAGSPGGAAPLRIQPVDVELQSVKFDLTLSLARTPEGLSGTLSYRTDLFERSTVSRMAEHLATLLESAVSSPEAHVGELSLLRDAERHQVLEAFNASPNPFVAEGPLHALIEAQAARHPSRPAVACEEQVLTYGELDTRANQLAWHLRSLGVGPDTCVALCLERSVDTVVALLGIWKAGAAYVPLDPAQPALRLRTLVEEVAAPVVVTQSRHADAFTGTSVQRVLMDTEAEQLASGRGDAPPCAVSADNLAYVLFTSGSTGRPKGVAVAHGQLVHYVRAATERLGLADCKSFALVSTFVAD
ncbi:non-ribosomal peptide synthetase, partial [Pyxidicoccus caerfyrddinensis]|uniref:non-ribosomal peptide synthetase n=2 Tax=Myxococcaceae TaxID=31 RepID=UPI0013DCBEE3